MMIARPPSLLLGAGGLVVGILCGFVIWGHPASCYCADKLPDACSALDYEPLDGRCTRWCPARWHGMNPVQKTASAVLLVYFVVLFAALLTMPSMDVVGIGCGD